MRVPRKDETLNDYLEVLDEKFILAQSKSKTDLEALPRALELLSDDENRFIDREIERCMSDTRYFMENYYVIRDERGNLRTLYQFWSHQEILHEVIEEEWKKKGCCRLIVLKPRQAGSTTWNAARIFHSTIFVPNTFSLVMAQDDTVSGEIYQRIIDAYHNLPFWLRPEYLSKQQGRQVIFQRSDEYLRSVDPGLGSTLLVSNAQKSTGVAIGRTIKNILASEASRWPDPQVWTADIKPSLNAPDMLGVIESTAFGRSGLFYNLWRAAEAGKSIWRALFIPVYKVKKYFLPVYKSDNFVLNDDEKALRRNVHRKESYTIPLGFFKWRREQIVETIAATRSDETFLESYPITAGEAFISSGFCAFPRKCLNEQEQKNCRPPKLIGEIEYNNGYEHHPVLKLHAPDPEEVLDRPEQFNRLWVWEEPDDNEQIEYYIGADVASGTAADYSDAAVYKIGYGNEPSVQVAEWHGWVNASYFARIIAAMGYWYHTAEIAVEYARDGITTGNELKVALDYPAIYRWRKMDRIQSHTQIMHWLTNHQTRDDAINRMSQHLLDKTVVIRNRHLIEEMRDFGRFEGETKAEGMDSPDDMVMANIIALAALYQTGKRQEWSENVGIAGEGSKHAYLLPKAPQVYGVYNQLGQQVTQCDSEAAAVKIIEETGVKYGINLKERWKVVPLVVGKFNTCWSPVWDSTGAEHELATIHNYGPREQMQNPTAVSEYRKLMHLQSKFGEDLSEVFGDDE